MCAWSFTLAVDEFCNEDNSDGGGGSSECCETKEIKIVGGGREVGSVIVTYCERMPEAAVGRRGGKGGRAHGSFHAAIASHSKEIGDLGRAVFDTNGRIYRQFCTERNMLWGSEVKIEQSALLERLEIQEKYRGWGIGTWFFDEVWKSDLDHGVPKASFLFVRPEPIFALVRHPLTGLPSTSASEHADSLRHARTSLHRFYRRVRSNPDKRDFRLNPTYLCAQAGFRKVCGTDFLCLARDPEHPSRLYSAEADVRA